MPLLIDPPASYIAYRAVTVPEALAALRETREELDRIGAVVNSADGMPLPANVAAEYRAMQTHCREAGNAKDRDDLVMARYHWQQGRECAARLAAYLRQLDPTLELEDM